MRSCSSRIREQIRFPGFESTHHQPRVTRITARNLADCDSIGAKKIENMPRAYDILRKLENGEVLPIASRNDLSEAKQLAESLNAYWPAEYVVRECASGAEFHLKQPNPADQPQGAQKREYVM